MSTILPDYLKAADEIIDASSSIYDFSNVKKALYASMDGVLELELYKGGIKTAISDNMKERTIPWNGKNITFINNERKVVVHKETNTIVQRFESLQQCWLEALLPLLVQYTDLAHQEHVGDLIWFLNHKILDDDPEWNTRLYPYLQQFVDAYEIMYAGIYIYGLRGEGEIAAAMLPYMIEDDVVYVDCDKADKVGNFGMIPSHKDQFVTQALIKRKEVA